MPGQAATEYLLITARDGLRAIAEMTRRLAEMVATPRGIVVASGVILFMILALGHRRRF